MGFGFFLENGRCLHGLRLKIVHSATAPVRAPSDASINALVWAMPSQLVNQIYCFQDEKLQGPNHDDVVKCKTKP
jgi:hypothetical protein